MLDAIESLEGFGVLGQPVAADLIATLESGSGLFELVEGGGQLLDVGAAASCQAAWATDSVWVQRVRSRFQARVALQPRWP
jgi:hypothetical protein